MFYSLIVSDIVMVIVTLWKYNRLPPQIPLFYSQTIGADQLADTWMIIILPFLMNLFVILNYFIYRKFFSGNILAKQILYYLNFFLIISFTFIFIKIITLIT